MKKAKYLLGVLFIMSIVVQAQEIKIPDDVIYSYNSEDSMYLFASNKIYQTNVLNRTVTKSVEFNTNGFDIVNYTPIKVNETFYFVHLCGGMVLKLVNDMLIRIDNSFDHKMQFGSAIFKHNNEIYRFGGYGFFSVRDFLIKFDFKTKEWESTTLNEKISPSGRYDFTHIYTRDQLIIIGGKTVNPLDRKERISLEDSWIYSFKDKKWNPIVTSEYCKVFDSNTFNVNTSIGNVIENKMYLYNYQNLEFEIYDINNELFKIDKKFPVYFFDNKYHFIINRNNSDKVLITKTKKELLGEIRNINKLKKSYDFFIIILVLLGFASIVLIVFFIRRIRNSILMYPDKIRYKRNFISISSEEHLVLCEFISNNNILENNKLQGLLDKEQYDRSHNVRLKNNLVASLNSKFKYLLADDSKLYIQTKKSEFDGRYKSYFLDLGNLKIISK